MLRRFAGYYRPHRTLFILDFLAASVIAGLDLVFPSAVRSVMNLVQEQLALLSYGFLLRWGALLLLLHFARLSLNYFVNYYGHMVGIRIEYDMRRDLFDRINAMSFSYFDNMKTGQMMSRIVNDLNEITELAHHGPEDLFTSAVLLVGAFFMMFRMHFLLAVIILALTIPMIWVSVMGARKIRGGFRALRGELGDINAQVEDSLSGVRVVKSFTGEAHEKKRFDEGNRRFTAVKAKAYLVMTQFSFAMNFFTGLMPVCTLVIGGIFMIRREMGLGELTAFLLYVELFLKPIRTLESLTETYQRGMASFARFDEMMQTQPSIQDKPGAVDVGRLRGKIEFSGVGFGYNENAKVLQNIHLTMEAGSVVALVGPSGGGKTTLCNLIPRFYEPTGGAVTIDGIDVRDMTQKSLRRNIGIVHQDVYLFSGSVRENIAYGKIGATDGEIVDAAKRANAHEFILAMENGYDTPVGQRGVKLSGGQKQRIAIARIFLKNPPILLLDEATSALDNETERIVQESLFSLSENRTTLIIAHRLATIRSADMILVMTDEGIVERGTHRELLSLDGLYAQLYNAQFDNREDAM